MAATAFDQTIDVFVQATLEILGHETLARSWLLRDSAGRLTLVTETEIEAPRIDTLARRLSSEMLPYIRPQQVVVFRSTPGIDTVFRGALVVSRPVQVVIDGAAAIVLVRLIDRRIIGRDWQAEPAEGWQPPAAARLVFASLKGGVGRSTALAVLAADLARDGKNVLVIDLDLEAPGIGTMLIGPATRPVYGVLDWMVETNLRDVDAEFLTQMIAPSDFSGGRGIIDVVPAVGTSSDRCPHNVLSKLARAYLEDVREGADATFLDKVSRLIDALSGRRSYDAILVDARAGLHETTAASILGLGADVLFFGMDSPQTFESYRFLFSQMSDVLNAQDVAYSGVNDANITTDRSNVSPIDRTLMPGQMFVRRLRFVHAKSPKDEVARIRFRDKLHELFAEFLYRSASLEFETASDNSADMIFYPEFGLDDETAPHYAWPIFGSTLYADFDPFAVQNSDRDPGALHQLDRDSYEEAFGEFLVNVRERIRLPRTAL
ncbi:KGGVGR-motif variant AAA ATPase [Burkholderia gladioli]|uniref:KGGVGR-motif variant AAA ATPase n=1 Tax=Burkholderia gladioli TaxID=28095 RepID=UPI00163F4954|nr:P-loop NTPase [Burkholderia gladioli]